MDANPLFEFERSVHGGSVSSSSSSVASFTAPIDPHAHREPPPPHAPSSLQTVNIKCYVPTILDIVNPIYPEWRCFFDSVVGKFGLQSHLAAALSDAHRADPDNTVSRDVLHIVRVPGATAFTIWAAIIGLFRDHQLHRAVYLEAEYRSLYPGDLSITDYTAKLKELADALRDLGQTVSEPSQVLNMLRGLNGKFRHIISTITSKQPQAEVDPILFQKPLAAGLPVFRYLLRWSSGTQRLMPLKLIKEVNPRAAGSYEQRRTFAGVAAGRYS